MLLRDFGRFEFSHRGVTRPVFVHGKGPAAVCVSREFTSGPAPPCLPSSTVTDHSVLTYPMVDDAGLSTW